MLGFIGCGKMANLIIRGIVDAELIMPGMMIASATHEETLFAAEDEYQIFTSLDNQFVAEKSSTLILALRPGKYPEVIPEIRDALEEEDVVISLAPRFTLKKLEDLFQGHKKIARVLFNGAALEGKGIISLSFSKSMTKKEQAKVIEIFETLGMVEVFPENRLEAGGRFTNFTSVYIYQFIESLIEAGINLGMPREQASGIVRQLILDNLRMREEVDRKELEKQLTGSKSKTAKTIEQIEASGLLQQLMEMAQSSAKK